MQNRKAEKISNQQTSKDAIAEFNVLKEKIQDHLLERTSVVPEKRIEEIETQYKVHKETAKLLHVLEFEYNIPINKSVIYYQLEKDRLKEAKYELPEIYTFLIRFSVEEGFWIKYLTIDFQKQLLQKSSKLINLDRSLFGDLRGEKEDSALYILERNFICEEFIRPMLQVWVNEHQRSNYLDATRSILSKVNSNVQEPVIKRVDKLCNNLIQKMESIKGIISELDSKGWAHKAIDAFTTSTSEILKFHTKKSNMTWKVAAEIVLENLLQNEMTTKASDSKEISSVKQHTQQSMERKRDPAEDELINYLIKLIGLNKEKTTELMTKKIEDLFDQATIGRHMKPSIFAKDFLERTLKILALNDLDKNKQLKQFDSKLMYRLSPMGTNEFPNMSVDEKVLDLVTEQVLLLILTDGVLQSLLLVKPAEKSKQETHSKDELDTEIEPKKPDVGKILHESSEKEIWILIRDSYLKELFDNPEELVAGANVLKKLSLLLGLLLTESEAKTILIKELEKKGIEIGYGNKEEIDQSICKIIFAQIKEQRKYKSKI